MPGRYVMKLLDSQSNRQILHDADETKLEMTILASPAFRLDPTGDTRLTFYDEEVFVVSMRGASIVATTVSNLAASTSLKFRSC